MKKKYFCKICDKEITKYSKLGYCLICSNKFTHKKKKIYYCEICGKEKSKIGNICASCRTKMLWENGTYNNRDLTKNKNGMFGVHRYGKSSANYIDGRSIKENKCLDCNIKIISEAKRCGSCNVKYLWRIGKLNNDGKIFSEETKKKISLSNGGTGIPYENNKYPKEFYHLRESIRKRDNYTCQNCSMTEEEHLIVHGRVLDVHHIDYNKKNCNEDNLITLCKHCNIRANHNKDYWQKIYKNKIGVIYVNIPQLS